jgi:hypothetical protein
MDHLDKLDYVFLGYSVAGFLLCVIAMWRQKPYRQVEAQSFQLRGDPTLHAAQIKGASHGRKWTLFRRICNRWIERTPTGAAWADKEFRFVDDRSLHFDRSTIRANHLVADALGDAARLTTRTERQTAMERGFWITLSNSTGILDSAFARTEEQAMELAIELLSGLPDRDEGDLPRLRIEAGEVYRSGSRSTAYPR